MLVDFITLAFGKHGGESREKKRQLIGSMPYGNLLLEGENQ